jgi:hypothetical protein
MPSQANLTLKPLARQTEVISEDLVGECVVYDKRTKKVHHLNSTLTWIWHNCDGNRSVAALASDLENQFKVADGMHFLVPGLEQLESCRLLEPSVDISRLTAGGSSSVTRRAVVAGSILMPAVVSLVAPTPAAARSPSEKPKPPKPPTLPKPPKRK